MIIHKSTDLLNPKITLLIIFGAQFFLWVLFFPLQPSFFTGEPKELSFQSLSYFLIIFIVLLLGSHIGQITNFLPATTQKTNYQNFYKIANITLYITTISTAIKIKPIIQDPTLIFLFLEPSGANTVHKILSESPFGIASLQTLWIIPSIIYAFIASSRKSSNFSYFKIHFLLLILTIISISALNSARIILINFLIVNIFVYVYFKRPKISFAKVLTAVFIFTFIYWASSIFRDGLFYADSIGISVFDYETTKFIFTTFIENYIAGEFNGALVLMSYEPSLDNFAFGTALNALFPSSVPPRNIFTINTFAYWYWQFGIFGAMLFALILGVCLGSLYKKSFHPKCNNFISKEKIIYIIFYIGIFNMTRLNYFFLQAFIIPVTSTLLLLKINDIIKIK